MADYFALALTFGLAFVIVLRTIPKLVDIALSKNIVDVPNHRKLNKKPIPTLGGIGVFIGIIVSTTTLSYNLNVPDLGFIFTGMILMLYVGIADDLLDMKASKKLIYQILTAGLIVFVGGLRFKGLDGLFGIIDLSVEAGCLLTLVVYIGLTNALNLIDGIDGLASGFGILASLVLSAIFYFAGDQGYSILCMATAGSLLPFFFFNVFGHRNKIFMGDTGSLILGILFAAICVHFNNSMEVKAIVGPHSATLLLAIFSVPVFDTLRVMLIRMLKGRSPFLPDKRHLHHRIIQLGFSHWSATRIILGLNALTIGFAFILSPLKEEWQVVFISLLGVVITAFPAIFLKILKTKYPNTLRLMRVIFHRAQKKQAPVRNVLTTWADKVTWN
ncbi:undecaprenyl/decaprenyl-phosphate alpha-N-acetylglucosaminyl 1-phosphate transferase [Prolixibacteraceae bacterium JC049]|nr:undecaprenyl/decaprenyl-phosphate alpha-N-acetylglucosaminyl 1-phosphate transferase [Prolixibacteraceae bacterium JC049]